MTSICHDQQVLLKLQIAKWHTRYSIQPDEGQLEANKLEQEISIRLQSLLGENIYVAPPNVQ